MENKQYNLPTFAEKEAQKPVTSDFELKQANILKTAKDLVVKTVFSVTNTETSQLRGQRFGRTYITTSLYTCSTVDYLVAVGNLGVAPTIGLPLPSLVGGGKHFIIKDEVGGATTTNVTIRSDGEKLIDGSSSTTLSANYQVKRFYTDGNNWFTC